MTKAGAKQARRRSAAGAVDMPGPEAFHVETIVDPFTLEKVVGMVRHPQRPCVMKLARPGLPPDDDECQRLGLAYLDALQGALQFEPPEWIHPAIREALEKPRQPRQLAFGWFPVTWKGAPADNDRKPLGSFWADRDDGEKVAPAPRLLVLLAGSVVTEHQLQMGSDMGLRIVMHVHRDEVRIHGITLSGLTTTRAVDVIPALRPQDDDIYGLVSDVRTEVGQALSCGQHVWVANIEKAKRAGAPAHVLTATGYAMRWGNAAAQGRAIGSNQKASKPSRARAYDFRVDLSVDPGTGAVRLVRVHRDQYIGSGATGETSVEAPRTLRGFVQDAASKGPPQDLARRRPTLGDAELDEFRDDIDVTLAFGKALQFSDGESGDLFETRSASAKEGQLLRGRTVAVTAAGVVQVGAVQTGYDTGPVIRSDEQASVETHLRGAELFGRMLAYGIGPKAYFRFARLPLVQRARPQMRWAPDGDFPSAEVRPFLGDSDAHPGQPAPKARDPLQLLVKYGSADPMNRRKLHFVEGANGDEQVAERRKAQYLSVASDPRWAWHEFGHVLNFASTGELEFPFAHSAGDALAAIAADPISELATGEDPEAEIRHVTFPWIEVPGRSHGRTALRGYGWCGCRNIARLDFTASLERYHHTYYGEQLLSSSLFRLYRSLGGDTRDPADDARPSDQRSPQDEAIRLSASDYCIYLIMRGISLLGPDSVAPARTPDQFVSALIEADLGTGAWNVEATWPFNRDARKLRRQGGRVHKVIRWAFEQQGLYATVDPLATCDGLGLPPAVDVFIADRKRPGGGYDPIPLRPRDHGWHAAADALQRQGQGRRQLVVTVGNRGSTAALQTCLRVWLAPAAPGGTVRWAAARLAVAPQNIPGDANVQFTLSLPANAGVQPLWILVSADAPADPSNLTDDLPPASWPELLELVAHDNNLALARL